MFFISHFSRCRPNRITPSVPRPALRDIKEELSVLYSDIAKFKSRLVGIKIILEETEGKSLYSLRSKKVNFVLEKNIIHYRQKYLRAFKKLIQHLKYLLELYIELNYQADKIIQLESTINIHQILFEFTQFIFNNDSHDNSLSNRLDLISFIQEFTALRKNYIPMLDCDIDSYMLIAIQQKISKHLRSQRKILLE